VVSTVSVPFWGVGVGNAAGCGLSWVVFGALLGPEATGPATMSCRARQGRPPFLWGCSGVSGFPVLADHAHGLCVWGVGVGVVV